MRWSHHIKMKGSNLLATSNDLMALILGLK